MIKEVEKIPGPGQYAPLIVTKRRTPSWGLGTMKRVEPGTENKVRLAIPGPTAYNLPSKKIIPGPGAYTPSVQKQANFSFSFGLKNSLDPHIKHVKQLPGPGAYETQKFLNFSRIGASLDKSSMDFTNMNKTQILVPGPGAYQPTNSSLMSRNSSPKYGFGTSDRRATTSQNSVKNIKGDFIGAPGPGQYEFKSIIGNEGHKKTLSYRFTHDLTTKEHNMKPGPGQYAPEIMPVIKSSPKYRIGTSTRDNFYLKDKFIHELPPPNGYHPKYENTRRNSPSTGFGYGNRSFLNRTFEMPGPGNYQTPTKVGEGPKYIMGAKLNNSILEKNAKEQPSPDNYNPKFEVVRKQTGVYSVSRAKRESMERKNNVPGPGLYFQPDATSSFRDSPKYGFGSSSQRPNFKQKVEVPGPGSYKLKSTIADVPAYLIPNQKLEYKFV
eukprot:403347820